MFVVGRGSGGNAKFIGNTTTDDECANLVRRTEPRANGASRSRYGSCYAEFGATGSDGSHIYRTCLFRSMLM